MALKKPPFETQETSATATVEAAAPAPVQVATPAPAPTPAAVAAASVEATTAIAKAASTSLAPRKAFSYVLAELEKALDPVNVGDLPRLKSGAGNIKDADGTNYGSFIKLELLSFHDSWTISPGSDSDEAKPLVRYSLDGKFIDGTGESVTEYLENLKTVEGYDKANVKRYLILAGIIDDCEKAKEKVGSIVQVSMAPQSAKTFNNYHMQRSVLVSRGALPADGSQLIKITAVGATMNGKDFTRLEVTSAQ
jgi:hypothetical protein